MKYKIVKRFIYSEIVYVESDSKSEAERIAIDQEEPDEICHDDELYECIISEIEEQK